MIEDDANDIVLEDGSNIAVIGGGPSGSFFAYFALDFAKRLGLEINIDVFEAKDFTCAGPLGCNNCGGIVSESLIQTLSTEGIVLPSDVIRRGIESYTMHLEQGSAVIETPLQEQRIASMFRGFGPLGCENNELKSFDNYLVDLCKRNGANIIYDKVIVVERRADGIIIKTKKSFEKKYELVVGANGLNKKTHELFQHICPSFIPPKTTKTFISEIFLDTTLIDEHFGNSMHVFLLNMPNVKFGALIPKGQYVTLVLLGSDIDKDIVSRFLESEPVKRCFPTGTNILDQIHCHCYPMINIQGAKTAFDDRVILIGDTSSSKLYKNGIGAAHITAKAAAKTAIFDGISNQTFKKYYLPVCEELDKDNSIGKFIFAMTSLIQRSPLLKRAVLNMALNEQKRAGHKRRMSAILWDTFTGSASYKDIMQRFLNPLFIVSFIWHISKAVFHR